MKNSFQDQSASSNDLNNSDYEELRFDAG